MHARTLFLLVRLVEALFWKTAVNLVQQNTISNMDYGKGHDSVKTYRLHENPRNLIWIRITRWSPILKVPTPILSALSRNPYTATTIRDAPSKGISGSSFVFASHTLQVAFTVHLHVIHVTRLEFLHGGFDVLHASLLAHLL